MRGRTGFDFSLYRLYPVPVDNSGETMTNLRYIWLAGAAAIFLAGCEGNGARNVDTYVDPTESSTGGYGTRNTSKVTDLIDLESGSVAGADSLTPVNRYLWRASLDTLSYLPLASTDPFTGVIATDWAASPNAPGERFKVTAYVNSPSLTANSLQVAVFREVRSEDGGWVTAPVAGTTARQLEDAILLRARQLKIDERENG